MLRKPPRPFHPPANRESYKDLLIFEERLKQNAERLQKQRRKYQGFLLSLVAVIAYLAYIVFIQPSIYSLVHYSNIACLLVAATTLILFFATGMYSDKIAYAYKFVPQANRALRPFNIYLNTRHKSRFSFLNPFRSSATTTSSSARKASTASPSLSRTASGRSISSSSNEDLTLSRQTSASSLSSQTSFRSTHALHSSSSSRSNSPSPPPSPSLPHAEGPVTRVSPSPSPSPPPSQRGGIPIPPIPPAQNPRGELIFSSRVNPTFREGYERYRGEWERRRKETKENEKRVKSNGKSWKFWSKGTRSGNREGGNEKISEDTRGRSGGAEAGGGQESFSADSSRLNSRSNSTERQHHEDWSLGQNSRGDARSIRSVESTLSTISTPATASPSPSRPPSPSPPPTLAPLPLDDSTSTPPPQSQSHSRTRAESFSELLDLEAASREDGNGNSPDLGLGGEELGPPGPPALTRTSSYVGR